MDTRAALLIWIGAASLAALALTIWDKRAARRSEARMRERSLLGAALAGGSLGLLLGMAFARHKTRKPAFLAKFALVLALQALALWIAVGQGWLG